MTRESIQKGSVLTIKPSEWTYFDALRIIPQVKKIAICKHYLESIGADKGLRTAVMEKIAIHRNFRAKTLLALTVEKQAAYLASVIGKFSIGTVADILVDYHGEIMGPLMETFLDELSIPNDNGRFDEKDLREPTIQAIQKAVELLDNQFEHDDIDVYLATLLAHDKRFSNVAPVLEKRLRLENASVASDEERSASFLEQNEGMTTLDEVLIGCVVDSAQEIRGALNEDKLLDLIEEVITLNADRQSAYFHKGFFEAIFGKRYDFSFKSQNLNRRAWYLTGIILGLLRKQDNQVIVKMCSQRKDIIKAICGTGLYSACYKRIAPHLFDVYVEENMIAEAVAIVDHNLPQLDTDFVQRALEIASGFIRESKTSEALLLLGTIAKNLPEIERLRGELPQAFSVRFRRKQGQAYQLKGDLGLAKSVLSQILSDGGLLDLRVRASVLSDLGLVEGGFRSISEVRFVERNKEDAFKSALERGRSFYEEAVSVSDGTPNACYCLGLLGYMQGDFDSAITYLEKALPSMLREASSYTDAGILDLARFSLAAAIFESLDEGRFKYAEENLRMVLDKRLRVALHIYKRLIEPIYNYDMSLTAALGEYLLDLYGDRALEVLAMPQVLARSEKIQTAVSRYCESRESSVNDKWNFTEALLQTFLSQGAPEKAADMLDRLEHYASVNAKLREKFVALLDDPHNFDPAWEQDVANYARVRMLELSGKYEEAASLLIDEFYHLSSREDDSVSVDQAEAILDCIKCYGIDDESIEPLQRRMEGLRRVGHVIEEISVDKPFSVLFVGGDERQEKFDENIIQDLTEKNKGIKVDFYHTNWKSSWGEQLEKIKSRLKKYDAIIIMQFIRTELGRRLRKLCGEHGVFWLPCTGRGKNVMERSIIRAYLFFLNKVD